ncbi:polyglutamine-binding protein 1-like protein [Leptotrombidium deliense]|uniref:Polyglutamine-binding protein 1 n=1 Tax=Leptotrombidium deliense TaxID=299467 RepID=A0A443SCG2_9ACAR|nr:polyglutamine-binding protein 1-like protein [Leptotrombidium deliense]
MPLPPALLARLQKRGIVTKEGKKKCNVFAVLFTFTVVECEEVIAEDYDEPNSKTNVFNKKLKVPAVGCPNKYNIYHECGDFCQRHWGSGKDNPSPTMQRKYQKLLKKYPLSDEWQQVWDAGVACYYFWNTINDEVSWLPPLHPKSVVSVSANKLRAMLKENENVSDESSDDSSEENMDNSDSNESTSSESESEVVMESEAKKKKSFSPQKRHQYLSSDSKGRERVKRNDLDPMDPAAYSNTCPRGKWSDGLESQGEAKSGADSTASGPLFQMRPYPNPGSILRMNKKLKPDDN